MSTLKATHKGPLKGRGTPSNPKNRFERLDVESVDDPEAFHFEDRDPAQRARPKTMFLRDASRSVLSRNESPDVPYSVGLNPYRGCEHGCSYCYARPFHEYLGFSAGLDFETKILVKEDAPELLRKELMKKSWTPQPIGLSGVTDAWQPIERKMEVTRRCLEVLAEFRNPVMAVTKNSLIARDVDHLAKLAEHDAVSVAMSITSLDPSLAARLEPRAAAPRARLRAMRELSEAGVPVGVLVAPLIPAINEHEIPAILDACAEAGACFAGFIVLRLSPPVDAIFLEWLEQHFPDRREKVLSRIRELRGGKLHDSRFGARMKGRGIWAEQLRDLFHLSRKKVGLQHRGPKLSAAAFQRPGEQLSLF